jgi:signal transduction histidine kinase
MIRSGIPLAIKVPLIVIVLMVSISVVVSERVMSTLVATQERHIRDLGTAYLDGLASSLVPHILRSDVWEVFDTLDRSRALYRTVRPVETVVADAAGRVLAGTDPLDAPSFTPIPDRLRPPDGLDGSAIDGASGRAYLARDIVHQGVSIGSIHTVLDVAPLIAERGETITVLVTTNAILTLILTAIGYLAIVRLMSPMRLLTEHLASGAGSPPVPVPPRRMPRPGTEAHRLLEAYNRLVATERERARLASRLAEEERLASLGRLASGMAHEINNPLGGLFAAIDTLKRHGEKPAVRARAVGLIERGLGGIRDVVAAALDTYRPGRSAHPFGAGDVDDIRTLVAPEVRRKGIAAEWRTAIAGELPPPAGSAARQILLNLVLNAVAASPDGGALRVVAATDDAGLVLTVSDGGPGLPAAARALLLDAASPAPIGQDSGLGVWMVRRAVTEAGGTITTEEDGGGTTISVRIPFARPAASEVTHAAA